MQLLRLTLPYCFNSADRSLLEEYRLGEEALRDRNELIAKHG